MHNAGPRPSKSAFLFALGLFVSLVALLFQDIWLGGQAIQGIDANYSWRMMLSRSLEHGANGWWNPYVWLGMGQGFGINSVFLFLGVLPLRWELPAGYAAMMLLSMLFTRAYLRRLGLGHWAAVFGAVSIGLAPHFVTLIHPSHWDAVHTLAFIPMLFYFLHLALDAATPRTRAWACAVAAGLAWGLLMNAEVQRGLYVSVAAGAYGLFLLRGRLPRGRFSPARLAEPSFLAGLARLVLAGLFMLLVFAGNAQIQFGSELVSGQPAGEQSDDEKWAFATSWSFHPKELADSLAPGLHGMLSGDPERPYWGSRPVAHSNDGLGLFVTIFGMAGILLAFRSQSTVRFYAIAALLATLLAFGEYWPGRPLFALWYQLPMMDKMRAPVKFMCVTAFAMAVLAAFGFQRFIDDVKARTRRALLRWSGLFLALAAVAGIGLIWAQANGSSLRTGPLAPLGPPLAEAAVQGLSRAWTWTLLLSLAAGGAVGLCLIRPGATSRLSPAAIAGGGLLFLHVASLFAINQFYVKRSLFSPEDYFRMDPTSQYLLQNNPQHQRVAASFSIAHQGRPVPLPVMANHGAFVTHFSLYHGIQTVENTPQARIADDYTAFFGAMLPALPQVQTAEQLVARLIDGQLRFWRLSSVGFLLTDGFLYGLTPQPLPIFELLKRHPALELVHTANSFDGRPHAIFRIRGTLPQFSLRSAAEAVADADQALARLRDPAFNIETGLLVPDGQAVSTAPSTPLAEVEVLDYQPGLIRLRTMASTPALLLWNGRFDAGWKARAGAEPLDIFPANYIMTGVAVPAGEQEITLRFSPAIALQKISIAATLAGFLALPIALWPDRRRARAPEAQP